jgi:iron complex transport system ATP-binding protein
MTDPALSASGLGVERFGRTLLSDFELRAEAGEVVALVGPNGAGKSSALKALSGLWPYTGSVRLQGRELRGLELRERARSCAYVPQQSLLQQGISTREVIGQGRYAHDPRWPLRRGRMDVAVERAIDATQLRALAERPWDRLSGGEQRRVLLARALATEAPIVLLDEPTAALDVGHALRFLQLLRQLAAAGRCIVLALHDLEQVRRFSDRALLLDRGRLIASGPPGEILSTQHLRPIYGVEIDPGAATGYRLVDPA